MVLSDGFGVRDFDSYVPLDEVDVGRIGSHAYACEESVREMIVGTYAFVEGQANDSGELRTQEIGSQGCSNGESTPVGLQVEGISEVEG